MKNLGLTKTKSSFIFFLKALCTKTKLHERRKSLAKQCERVKKIHAAIDRKKEKGFGTVTAILYKCKYVE